MEEMTTGNRRKRFVDIFLIAGSESTPEIVYKKLISFHIFKPLAQESVKRTTYTINK